MIYYVIKDHQGPLLSRVDVGNLSPAIHSVNKWTDMCVLHFAVVH